MTTAGSQACAACKYQRRKCSPDCPLAPHFPSNRQQDFLNAHRLFGVSNILKTLKTINSFEQKQIAAKTLIFQANARARDPVGGCFRIISSLESQFQFYQHQLNLVRQQIAIHRRLATHLPDPDPNSDPNSNTFNVFDPDPVLQSSSIGYGYGFTPQEQEESSINVADGSHNNYQALDLGGFVKIEMEELSSSSSGLRRPFVDISVAGKQPFAADVSEDVKPFLGGFDERNDTVFLDSSKELIQRSGKMVLKEEEHEPIQHEQEQNLKNAASQFTSTNGKDIDDSEK